MIDANMRALSLVGVAFSLMLVATLGAVTTTDARGSALLANATAAFYGATSDTGNP